MLSSRKAQAREHIFKVAAQVKLPQRANGKLQKEGTSEVLCLILFVHLALVTDADKALAATGLNRTHHRILFLVALRPGVTVGEIVVLLRVTAQAIQAPLRTLLDDGLVEQQSSERDRRRRHLTLTDRGEKFLGTLSDAQHSRIEAALGAAGGLRYENFLDVMRGMTDWNDREWLYPPVKAVDAVVKPRERINPAQTSAASRKT